MEMVMAKSEENLTKQLDASKDRLQVDGVDSENVKKRLDNDRGIREILINGLVARVHLEQFDLEGYFKNKSKSSKELEKKKNRGRPRKSSTLDVSKKDNSITESKKQKLREQDVENRVNKRDNSSLQIKKKKLIKRLDTNAKLSSTHELRRRFGEDNKTSEAARSNTPSSSRARVIKPNRKLQDFVISSDVRYYSNLQSPSSTSPKDKYSTPSVKAKVIRKSFDSSGKLLNNSSKSKMENKNDDDVVRSFLPVFDNNSQLEEEEDDDDDSDFNTIDEPLITFNKNVKRGKENEKSEKVKSLSSKRKPVLANGERPSKLITATLKDIHTFTPVKIISAPPPLPPPALKRPNETIPTDVAPIQKKQKLEKKDTGENKVEKSIDLPKKTTKVNGSNAVIKQQKKNNVRYVLIDRDSVQSKKKVPMEDVDFNKLVRSLKLVKLPASNWKIRIVVSKQQTITEVTFTNKEANERCIKFSRTITGYVITFGKSVVTLLGAPTKIASFNDVSILLDIIHNLSPNDPVLDYSTNN